MSIEVEGASVYDRTAWFRPTRKSEQWRSQDFQLIARPRSEGALFSEGSALFCGVGALSEEAEEKDLTILEASEGFSLRAPSPLAGALSQAAWAPDFLFKA